MPSSGIVGSYDCFTPNLLRSVHTVLHSDCINLHSHQQCKKVPFLPYCFQQLLFVDFLMLSTLTSLVAQTVKRLSTTWETRVLSLGGEDLLQKEMATHSSTLAWKIPWTEKPGRLQSMGSQRVWHDWVTSLTYLPILTDVRWYLIAVLISISLIMSDVEHLSAHHCLHPNAAFCSLTFGIVEETPRLLQKLLHLPLPLIIHWSLPLAYLASSSILTPHQHLNLLWTCAVPHCSHSSDVVIEHLKCGQSKLKCIDDTPDFKDLVWIQEHRLFH